jgi:predicted dehydrogenase
MLFVLGRMAGPVSAVFGQLQTSTDEAPSEELVSASLRFANGASGSILDSIASFRGMRIGVVGTRGTAVLTDDMAKRPGAVAELRWRREGEDVDQLETFPFEKSRPTRLLEFIDAIRHDRPSPILFNEALENLQVCQAIGQAHATGELIGLPPHTSSPSAPHASTVAI